MIEGIGFYCGIVMRWFRDAFCEWEQAEARATGAGPVRRDGGSGRHHRARFQRPAGRLLQRHGRQALGAGLAQLPAVRRRRPDAVQPEGGYPGHRGAGGVCLAGAPGDHRGADRPGRRRGGHDRRRGQGIPLAPDRRRRARRARPRAGGQGVDGPGGRPLRRRGGRHLHGPGADGHPSSSAGNAVSNPTRPTAPSTTRASRPGRRSTPGSCSYPKQRLLRPMWWPAGA